MDVKNIEDTGKVHNLVADSTRETTESLKQQLAQLQDKLARAQFAVTTRARNAALSADTYVHDNPWKATGFAAAIAAVVMAVTMLATRR
ncbi:MAG: DUF883 family protein [Burkholderiales bacterium]|nr:DUF883 family protein [Burkholderiales bacterium]